MENEKFEKELKNQKVCEEKAIENEVLNKENLETKVEEKVDIVYQTENSKKEQEKILNEKYIEINKSCVEVWEKVKGTNKAIVRILVTTDREDVKQVVNEILNEYAFIQYTERSFYINLLKIPTNLCKEIKQLNKKVIKEYKTKKKGEKQQRLQEIKNKEVEAEKFVEKIKEL